MAVATYVDLGTGDFPAGLTSLLVWTGTLFF
jgi:hypothetical protein